LRKELEKEVARKKYALLLLAIMLAVLVVNFSTTNASSTLTCSSDDNGVVKKAPGDAFTVKITFKNTGKTEGNWSINIAFEGDSWSQTGTAINLTLKPGNSKTLTWNGNVPANATVNSIARLVVYYNDSFKALDWWILVVPSAELSITASTVE
jgi:hypothetical protein